MSREDKLSLEKLKIHERLLILETNFKITDEKVDVIYKNIVGQNGNLGHSTRIDRLEISEKERKNSTNRLWSAIIAISSSFIGKLFYDFIKK